MALALSVMNFLSFVSINVEEVLKQEDVVDVHQSWSLGSLADRFARLSTKLADDIARSLSRSLEHILGQYPTAIDQVAEAGTEPSHAILSLIRSVTDSHTFIVRRLGHRAMEEIAPRLDDVVSSGVIQSVLQCQSPIGGALQQIVFDLRCVSKLLMHTCALQLLVFHSRST